MTQITLSQIEELKGLIERATPGPWLLVTTRKSDTRSDCWHEIIAEGRNPQYAAESAIAEVYEQNSDFGFDPVSVSNAALIVAAVNLAPSLIAEIEALRAESAAFESALRTRTWNASKAANMIDDAAIRAVEKAVANVRQSLLPPKGTS